VPPAIVAADNGEAASELARIACICAKCDRGVYEIVNGDGSESRRRYDVDNRDENRCIAKYELSRNRIKNARCLILIITHPMVLAVPCFLPDTCNFVPRIYALHSGANWERDRERERERRSKQKKKKRKKKGPCREEREHRASRVKITFVLWALSFVHLIMIYRGCWILINARTAKRHLLSYAICLGTSPTSGKKKPFFAGEREGEGYNPFAPFAFALNELAAQIATKRNT